MGRFQVHILLRPGPGFRTQPSWAFLTLSTSATKSIKSLFSTIYQHISSFLIIVWHCFHPEASFLVNLWFYNGDTVGKSSIKDSLVKFVRFPVSYILKENPSYILTYFEENPKTSFSGGIEWQLTKGRGRVVRPKSDGCGYRGIGFFGFFWRHHN